MQLPKTDSFKLKLMIFNLFLTYFSSINGVDQVFGEKTFKQIVKVSNHI